MTMHETGFPSFSLLTGPENELVPALSPSDQDTSTILISDLVYSVDSSVRLRNCLKNSDFPFKSISEYLAHPNPMNAVLCVQNAGKKTALELDAIIKSFLAQPESFLAQPDQQITPPNAKAQESAKLVNEILNETRVLLEAYKFPDDIMSLGISTRLSNVLYRIKQDGTTIFSNLADCIFRPEEISAYLSSQQSMGKKTLSEFHKLTQSLSLFLLEKSGATPEERDYIGAAKNANEPFVPEQFQIAILNKLKEANSKQHLVDLHPYVSYTQFGGSEITEDINEESIIHLIHSLLNEREFEILVRRSGLKNLKPQTLEEVSVFFNCTRERIRQIEKKAIKRLTVLKRYFHRVLDAGMPDIEETLFEGSDYIGDIEKIRQFKKLLGKYRISILVNFGSIEAYLKKHYQEYEGYWIKKSTVEGSLSAIKTAIDNGEADNPIRKRIIDAISRIDYPCSLTELEALLTGLPTAAIIASLKDDFDAIVNDGVVHIPCHNLQSSLRLVLALRYAGRSISLSEARFFHSLLFKADMKEHAIGAILGRLEEALIVDRGKYALYENISLNSAEVAQIREKSWQYLNHINTYVSVKCIFDTIFLGKHSFGADFNAYMLLGILQDDNRFTSKRGLMLGLDTFREQDFVGLNEQIYSFVDTHGPVNIRAIQEYLSKNRKVFDGTVTIVLDSSPDYVKVSPSTYMRLDKAVGDYQIINKLKYAIELSLIESDLSIFSLMERLHQVGLDLNKYVVISWLDKQDNIDRKKSIVRLAKPSPEIQEYNDLLKSLAPRGDLSELYRAFKLIAQSDYRLIAGERQRSYTFPDSEELDKLFREFEF